MKSLRTNFSVVVVTTLIARSLASAQSNAAQDSDRVTNYEVVVDFSLFPASEAAHGAYSWSPTFAIRAGLSRNLVRTINVEGYVEYYEMRLPRQEGNTSFSPAGAKRREIAAYVGLSLSRIMFLGLGTYHTSAPQVTEYDMFAGPPEPWPPSGFSEFRFFWTVGFNADIHLVDNFYIPVGLYYRNGYQGGITFFRVGTALRF